MTTRAKGKKTMTDKLHFDDLTQITCPFGLLDEDTQERLRAHGGPYEYFTDFDDGWVTNPHLSFPMFVRSLAYRAKPAPVTRVFTTETARIEELEAKLAKAVDALHIIAVNKTKVSRLADAKFVARTTLAELTGGKDE